MFIFMDTEADSNISPFCIRFISQKIFCLAICGNSNSIHSKYMDIFFLIRSMALYMDLGFFPSARAISA